ncbi:MAG TPA: hypothetical protein PLL71_16655, partial [Agriterribacter sp.]|nr:hypothetical protein [Agriterribacter sp.]
MFEQKTIHTIGLCVLCMVALQSVSQTAGSDVKFRKYHLWDEFYTEAATVADVNKDGRMDIIAGARWFEAPDWKAHDIWKHKKFDYTKGYSDSFLNFAIDVNEDGWVDLICF